MKMPGGERAYVPRHKITDYLLAETHPAGGPKAAFFRAFGFNDGNVGALEQGLLRIAGKEEVLETDASAYGAKYVIDGQLDTPSGTSVFVRTVWVVDLGTDRPRFVTAYPG